MSACSPAEVCKIVRPRFSVSEALRMATTQLTNGAQEANRHRQLATFRHDSSACIIAKRCYALWPETRLETDSPPSFPVQPLNLRCCGTGSQVRIDNERCLELPRVAPHSVRDVGVIETVVDRLHDHGPRHVDVCLRGQKLLCCAA